MVVLDGASFHVMERLRSELPTFSRMIEEGAYGPLTSSTPSLTPVALASLFTGFGPEVHGVISPKIFVKGRRIQRAVSAFSSESLKVDPIWATLSKRGLKVLITSAPQALPDKWKLPGLTLMDPYRARPKELSEGTVLKVGSNQAAGVTWEVSKEGGKFTISFPSGDGKGTVELENGQWSSPIAFSATYRKSKVEGITFLHARAEDVYFSPASFTTGEWSNDPDLASAVWEEVSRKQGMLLDGDYKSLEKGLISFEEYLETVRLSFNFFLSYTSYVLRRSEWDFASTYLPTIDNVQHLLYGVDDAFTLVVEAYRMADRFVGSQLGLADVIFVVSDHGVVKVRKRVNVNSLLRDINVLKTGERGIDWSRTKAYYGGGGVLRINLKGREEDGVVSKTEFPKLVRYIVKHLDALRDPETGEKVFVSIVSTEVPAEDRGADVFLTVGEGYSISSTLREEGLESVKPYRTITGDHGYYRGEDMYGVFLTMGDKIRKGVRVKDAKIVDVAPTICRVLGVNNNRSDGRVLMEVLLT